MKRIFLLSAIILLTNSLIAQTADYELLRKELVRNYTKPEDYVISVFKDHNFVFLGENHRIQHDVLFVTSLIPKLFKNGIFNLAIEFGDHKYQKQIDSLILASEWSQETYYDLMSDGFQVTWGYEEYLDIAKTIWLFNNKLKNKRKFRLILLGYTFDPCKQGLEKFGGADPDLQMADNLDNEVCKKHEKALIYSGVHHAFTGYRQPVYDFDNCKFVGFNDHRMGNIIKARYPEMTFTIFLHAPWIAKGGFNEPMIAPAAGVIDSLMKLNKNKPAGLDLRTTELGKITITDSYYMYGYNNFSLKDIYDGYIFLRPLSQYKNVTVAKNFYKGIRLEKFKAFLRCLKNIPEEKIFEMNTDEAENSVFQDGNIMRLYGHLITSHK